VVAVSRIVLVTLALASAGCSRAGRPCAAPDCGDGYECLANRCVAAGADPVAPGTERVVLLPVSFAVADGRANASAPTITLGNDRSMLLLGFDPAWKTEGRVRAAFLLLEPSPGTEPDDDVRLAVWTLESPFTQEGIARGGRPNLTSPHAEGVARSAPRGPVRIDVTDVVRALASQNDDGIAVIADGTRGRGITLLTGAGNGPGPRLDLYVESGLPR
jgi:hypothetical protein